MSSDDRSRSHVADGNRKDTERISTASLDTAHPHSNNNRTWNFPTPAPNNREKDADLTAAGRKVDNV